MYGQKNNKKKKIKLCFLFLFCVILNSLNDKKDLPESKPQIMRVLSMSGDSLQLKNIE